MNTPTPHINASNGNFAKTVLMPGDPLRSKYIAENFLENARLVNNVRGINGYTGFYKGKEVSVMASGMGMPSMGIYSYELFTAFDVDNIIRIGSAGSIDKDVHMRDLVFAMGASTNSNYAIQYNLNGTYSAIASYNLLETAVNIARASQKFTFKVGNVISSDIFYNDADSDKDWNKLNVLAVEMEAAALYMNAARCKKNALAICTISDNLITMEHLSTEERQSTFDDMIILALELSLKL